MQSDYPVLVQLLLQRLQVSLFGIKFHHSLRYRFTNFEVLLSPINIPIPTPDKLPSHAIKATKPPAKAASPRKAPTSLLSLIPTPALDFVVVALALILVALVDSPALVVLMPVTLLADPVAAPDVDDPRPVSVAIPVRELVVVAALGELVSWPSVLVLAELDIEELEDTAADGFTVVRTPPCKAAGADAGLLS
jgi:hypothetical protein